MWVKGKETRKKKFSKTNDKIREIKGYIDERKAKVLLYEFLYENVSYASDLLMNVQLFPFQHIAIKGMLEADYSLNVWSRGLSKSFTTAVFLLLHATFNQGVKCAILSKTFRQSKMVFRKMEEILENDRGGFIDQIVDIRKGTDEWLMTVGKSEIRALPLGDGEKLRGFRFNCVVVDEFLLMPEKIYNEVIKPFLSNTMDPHKRAEVMELENKLIAEGKMNEEDRTNYSGNKLVMLSSASYKFEFLYKIYETYEKLIIGDTHDLKEDDKADLNAKRIITHFAYDMAPPTLYDANLIKESKETMSAQQFDREFNSKFIDDSSGYFSNAKMRSCKIPDGESPFIEIVGDKKSEYIVTLDPSWSEGSSSDDFAIKIGKVLENGKTLNVHSYAVSGSNLKNHILYFLYILKNFDISLIVCDYNGGLTFVRACNESVFFKDAKIEIGIIDIDLDADEPLTYASNLQTFKNEYNKTANKICIMRKPTSQWIRRANEMLQASFDHKRILFAAEPFDDDFKAMIHTQIPELVGVSFVSGEKQDKAEDEKTKSLDLVERIVENINNTIVQCSLIEPTQNASGGQSFDLPASIKRNANKNKIRKDSYSALVLLNWAASIWEDSKNQVKQDSGFVPFLI